MVDTDELRDQFADAFEDAAYPVTSPMDLIPALPEGPSTTFESGDFEKTAIELNNEISTYMDFPYVDTESLADATVEALEAGDHL